MLEILAKQQGPDMEENTEDALAGEKSKKKKDFAISMVLLPIYFPCYLGRRHDLSSTFYPPHLLGTSNNEGIDLASKQLGGSLSLKRKC